MIEWISEHWEWLVITSLFWTGVPELGVIRSISKLTGIVSAGNNGADYRLNNFRQWLAHAFEELRQSNHEMGENLKDALEQLGYQHDDKMDKLIAKVAEVASSNDDIARSVDAAEGHLRDIETNTTPAKYYAEDDI